METRWPWYRDESVQQAVRQFILALVLLGMALMGYDVQVSRQPTPTAPIETPAHVEPIAR